MGRWSQRGVQTQLLAATHDADRPDEGSSAVTDDYAKSLGARLRAIRRQQGLSLHAVEQRSEGRWKAAVVGSYERGDRAVTVQRLAELADFYQVPLTELLPDERSAAGMPRSSSDSRRLVLNLERLAELPESEAEPLARFAAAIQ